MSKDNKSRTLGGKFQSTGRAEDQNANKALITRLIAEIGQDGFDMLPPEDRIFLQDTRDKLSDRASNMYGWRQVEAVVRIHAVVIQMRTGLDPSILNAPPFVRALARVQLERGRAVALHGELKGGPVRWERLISEEYQEVMDELATLSLSPIGQEKAIIELAQLAQLAMGVIELIQAGKLEEEA